MNFCCTVMEYYVSENKEIEFDAKLRSISLRLSDDMHGTNQPLHYCPWCGTKLPKDFDGIWSKILKEEYNLSDPLFDDADKVPTEFRTDEWWKKRGL